MCRWLNCRTVCTTPKEMNEHLEQHVKQEPWECLWSGCSAMVEKKRWMYRSSLLQHMSSHVPDYRPVGCPFCEFRAAFQWRMAAHIRRKHANKTEGGTQTTKKANSPASTTPGTPNSNSGSSSSSSNSGSTSSTVPLLFDGMPLSSLLSGPLQITTLPGDDSTPVFIRPATPPPQQPVQQQSQQPVQQQPQQSVQQPKCCTITLPEPPPTVPSPERAPMLPRIEALDRKRGTPPAPRAGVVRPRDSDSQKRTVIVHVKSNVDTLPSLFQFMVPPSLTVAQFLAGMHERYHEREPGKRTAFHLSLSRAPFGNVRHHVSIPLCKYEVPVTQLLQPNDHLILCAVAPQE